MKLKGTRGNWNIPTIRLSSGFYVRRRQDGLQYVSKRPVQPRTTDEASQFNRDQMVYSAYLAATAIPLEVQAAKNWAVNSNDTYKDALTRAQFGTLMRIFGPNGEQYFPADHSLPQPEQVIPGMPNFTLIQSTAFVTGTPIANITCAVPAGITEMIAVYRNVAASANSQPHVRISTNNGVSYHATLGDYTFINSAGTEANATGFLCNATNNTAAQSGMHWFPSVTIGQGAILGMSCVQAGVSGLFKANALPATHLQFLRPGANMTGTTGAAFVYFLGR